MEIKVICATSKKDSSKVYYALVINGTYVTFDVRTISRATGLSLRDIYLLNAGDEIKF